MDVLAAILLVWIVLVLAICYAPEHWISNWNIRWRGLGRVAIFYHGVDFVGNCHISEIERLKQEYCKFHGIKYTPPKQPKGA